MDAQPTALQPGDAVRFQEDDGSWVFGVIERTNGKVAIVQWNDGKNTQIYLSRLQLA